MGIGTEHPGSDIADRPFRDELHPFVLSEQALPILRIASVDGMGRAEAHGDDLLGVGHYFEIRRVRGMGADRLLGHPLPACSLILQLD